MTDHAAIVAQLFAAGLLEPNDVQIATIASGMVQQVVRTTMSMTVADAERLLYYAKQMARQARKDGDAEAAADFNRSAKTARAFLRFRREMERVH